MANEESNWCDFPGSLEEHDDCPDFYAVELLKSLTSVPSNKFQLDMSKPGPIALFPCHSIEDFPTHYRRGDAAGVLAAWTIGWCPEMIAASESLPRWASTDFLTDDLEGRLLLIPTVSRNRLCSDIEGLIKSGECQALYSLESRHDYLSSPEIQEWRSGDLNAEVIQEFFALAYGFLQVQLMTRQIRYSSALDEREFEARLVHAAQGAVQRCSDLIDRLQACYDLLLEERNRFYPTRPELLDLIMLAPTTLGSRCEKQLETGHKMNLLLTGQLVQEMQSGAPKILQRVQTALDENRAEVVGGLFAELPAKLMGQESQLHQVNRGIEEIQQSFGQRPKLFVRRTFGLNPKLPGLLRDFDFAGALHANLGRGSIPTGSSAMMNWEGSDGTTLAAIQQRPRDASDDGDFLSLGIYIGEALDSVHQSTVVFAHWPDRTCDTFQDLLVTCKYGPLLGEFVTASEYFEGFYDPGYSERFSDDEYRSRTLLDWVCSGLANPISRVVTYWENYHLLLASRNLLTLASCVQSDVDGPKVNQQLELMLNALGQNDRSLIDVEASSPDCSDLLSDVNAGIAEQFHVFSESGKDRDLVVFNPSSFARRVHICLPDVRIGAIKEQAPVVLADTGNFGSDLVVDLPAMGSVVIDQSERPGDALRKDPPVLDGLALRNEFFEVVVNEKTGGILSLNRHRKRGNLLTQRLSMRSAGEGGRAVYAEMVADAIESHEDSRIRARIQSKGQLLLDGVAVGAFEQTVSVVRGCPDIQMQFKIVRQIELSDKPWDNYFCSRWAWHDEAAEIRRESLGTRCFLMEEMIEAPNLIDIESEQAKISLLPKGLPFHRRSARRILDTLLAVRGENVEQTEMAIAVNVEMSTHKAMALATPVLLGYAEQGEYKGGWLFHLSSKNLMVTNSLPRFDSAGKLIGAMFRFQETEGRNGRLKMNCPRDVATAYRVNFLGEYQGDAVVDGRTVAVDFIPNQHFQIELNWKA